jgi:hypothetical protein
VSSSRFRLIALGLPGVVEASHQGHADFRAGKRIFATLGYPDQHWGMVKLTPEQQSVLVEAEPEIFRPVPGGWGKRPMCGSRPPTRQRCKAPSPLPGETLHRSHCSRSSFAPHQFASARMTLIF